MLYKFVSLLCFGCFFQMATAQQSPLFFPRNYQKAYDKGTRSDTGKPGQNYWQNRAKYVIEASVEPKTRRLTGSETIVYANNSPDTLKQLRFKLAHDRYRKGGQRAFDVTPTDVTDEGVRIESLTFNGAAVPEKNRRKANSFLDLDLRTTPITPRSEVVLTVKWSYTLPAGKDAARECTCDSTTFFVPYWYPQIAVYDDLNGWASAPYSGTQEQYHEFGDYDVTVTMPRGFQVWATGVWQNPNEVLAAPYAGRYKQAQESDAVISVFSEKEIPSAYLPGTQHKFRFLAQDVPDFAFATSDHYNWDATSVAVEPGRRVLVNAAYNTASTDYPQVAKIGADGIRLMSTWLPGYPFPYPVMSVFNGDDGMEYPMMCNDASTAPNSPMTLTVHEISHTYFPFMMGINEQDHAWMDEGWAAFFDYLLSDSLSNHTIGGVRNYSAIAGTDNDVPPMVKSRNLTTAYRNAAYQRPQNAYFTLLDLLGYETFHTCMKGYMDEWKGKHPAPFDFFNTWNRYSNRNLDWFWKPWFFDWGYPDLGIGAVKAGKKNKPDTIEIVSHGNLPVPIHLVLAYTDGTTETIHRTAVVWKNGEKTSILEGKPGKRIKKATLGQKTIPDTNDKDNVWGQ